MSSCNTSSNLSGNINVNNITRSGSRLLMTIPIDGVSGGFGPGSLGATAMDGVTAGDVIRYNTSTNLYVKSQGNNSENSEVVGVIETADSVNNVIDVVLCGQIIYPADRFTNATHIDPVQGALGASGGNDIYFLSEVTAGYIQNLAPNEPTTIAKPVLQVASDGIFNANVVNYIGYQIGGNAVAEETFTEPVGAKKMVFNFNEDELNNSLGKDWHRTDKKTFLPISPLDLYASDYEGRTYNESCQIIKSAGSRIKCVVSSYMDYSSMVGKKVVQKDSLGNITGEWTIVVADNVNNTLWLHGNLKQNVDASNFIRIDNTSYTISSSVITACMLPRYARTHMNSSFTSFTGKVFSIPEIPIMYAPPDGAAGMAVTLVEEMTLSKLVVREELLLENASVTVSDIAGLLNDMKNSLNVLERKVLNASTSFSQINNK